MKLLVVVDRNPFNGIESLPRTSTLPEASTNPFNGIESNS